MVEKKEIKVTALREGTVIDHLAPGTALQVVQTLGVGEEGVVLIGLNLESKKHSAKGIIKIEKRELNQDEMSKVALLSPEATISIIREFKVVEKTTPELPDRVRGLVKCSNPSCVTNHYDMETIFIVLGRNPVRVACHYCERIYRKDEIVFM